MARGSRKDIIRVVAPILKSTAGKARSRHLFATDLIGFAIGAVVAMALWLDTRFSLDALGPYLWIIGIIVATRIAVNILLGLYGHSWRYASVPDMGRIVACVVSGSAAAAGIVFGAYMVDSSVMVGVPGPQFWIMEMVFALATMAFPRFAIRAASDLRMRDGSRPRRDRQRTLLFGAGWAGVTMARSALRDRNSGVTPVGFLDSDLDLKGRRVGGLRVFGDLSALPHAIRKTKATAVLITMPSAAGESMREVAAAAMDQGLDVRTVPPVIDLLDGSLDVSRIRSLNVEDLLRRPLARDHSAQVHDVFERKTVVVTGAAGSIGSELVRQVVSVNADTIILVDQAESPLYLLQRELEERLVASRADASGPPTHVRVHLADVSSRAAMDQLLDQVRPDVVLHAAAYKHVPMLESHVSEAVRTNIGGTSTVVNAAAAAGVERFVLVSSDKAVWPSSVMGATKRVAEMIVAEAGHRLGRPYIAVRFGNVLGSNGSVVPIFQRQLESGHPLTITDPEMTRYFMTIPEAAWLILDAAAIAERQGLFVLDMGEPVKILDIAHDLIRLSGRKPGSVPIEVTGLREGEKLHEELFYDQEHAHPTEVAKVLRSDSSEAPPDIQAMAASLLALADGERDDQLRTTLHSYVRESVEAEEAGWGDEAKSESGRPRQVVAVPIHTNGVTSPVGGNGQGDANGQADSRGSDDVRAAEPDKTPITTLLSGRDA